MKEIMYTDFLDEIEFSVPISDYAKVSDNEIDLFEKRWDIKLPLVYRELLLKCGRYRGSNFFSSIYYFNTLPELWASIKEELRIANNGFDFSKNVFAFTEFLEHGKFWFFLISEGDDPPIYLYSIGTGKLENVYVTFSDCIKDQHWFKNRI
jgi:hypothetical protein